MPDSNYRLIVKILAKKQECEAPRGWVLSAGLSLSFLILFPSLMMARGWVGGRRGRSV